MQMTFRWYGDGNDDITPEMIRQIPGVISMLSTAELNRSTDISSLPSKYAF